MKKSMTQKQSQKTKEKSNLSQIEITLDDLEKKFKDEKKNKEKIQRNERHDKTIWG